MESNLIAQRASFSQRWPRYTTEGTRYGHEARGASNSIAPGAILDAEGVSCSGLWFVFAIAPGLQEVMWRKRFQKFHNLSPHDSFREAGMLQLGRWNYSC